MSRTVDLYPGAWRSFRSIPGHPRGSSRRSRDGLAGQINRDICRPARGQGPQRRRDLAMGSTNRDRIYRYGWHPGEGRTPAPGTQQLAGELFQALDRRGAQCRELTLAVPAALSALSSSLSTARTA